MDIIIGMRYAGFILILAVSVLMGPAEGSPPEDRVTINIPEKKLIEVMEASITAGLDDGGSGKAAAPGDFKPAPAADPRLANVLLRMGQRNDGLAILRRYAKDPVKSLGPDYVDAVKTIFVYEEDGKLILGAGLEPAWFEQGIEVRDIPTPYGKICYTIKKEGNVIKYFIYGNAKPPKGVRFILPREFRNLKLEEGTVLEPIGEVSPK